jgi:hypothetical protein
MHVLVDAAPRELLALLLSRQSAAADGTAKQAAGERQVDLAQPSVFPLMMSWQASNVRSR